MKIKYSVLFCDKEIVEFIMKNITYIDKYGLGLGLNKK